MNSLIELNLALILFLPWYLLLIWLFWRARAQGKELQRKLLALAFILAALFAAALGGIWAYRSADMSSGAIWKHILACVIGYWAFLVVLATGHIVLKSPEQPSAVGESGC